MSGDDPARRFALLLAYDGTEFHGWQVQPDARTVQGVVAAALRPLLGVPVLPTGASRTDAGVHALGQVVTFESPRALRPSTIQAALNATLPGDVRVVAARAASEGLDARRSARVKRYAYLMDVARVQPPFRRRYAWHVPRVLDTRAMREALGGLRGRHDFSAFRAAAGRDRAPWCTVKATRVVERAGLVAVLVSADAFLHHMVRNMVGTVREVGLGRRAPAWVGEVLAGRDRRQAGATAPARGLFLLRALYTPPLFHRPRPRAQARPPAPSTA